MPKEPPPPPEKKPPTSLPAEPNGKAAAPGPPASTAPEKEGASAAGDSKKKDASNRPARGLKPRRARKTLRPGALPPLPTKYRKQLDKDPSDASSSGSPKDGPKDEPKDDAEPAALPEVPKEEGKIKPQPQKGASGKDGKEDDASLSELSLPKAWRSAVPPSQQIEVGPKARTLPPLTGEDKKRLGESGGEEADPDTKDAKKEKGAGKESTARIGDYTLQSCLGSGGMAVIYKSIQRSLNRTVALKVLRPEVARERQFVQRFEREARTLASFQHENIIQVYAHQRDRRFQYFVMEYVDGIDLFDLMDHCGPLPAEVAAVIALQTARALEHAHYRGILHRDVKPANLMISFSGSVKLMDFGIAQVPDAEELTQHGTGLGTPSYMSPEQVVGDPLDGRTDIFSLGSVLYQMLTGDKPFIADENETVLQKIRLQKPPNPRKLRPNLPKSLERILQRCMQKRKGDRYWPTRELVKALERFTASRGVESENALLVSFFREKGFLDASVANEHLEMARQSGYDSASPKANRFSNLKAAVVGGAVAGGVLLLLFGFLLGWWLAPGSGPKGESPSGKGPDTTQKASRKMGSSSQGKATGPTKAGIRVVVNPWAHVWIDGKKVATTPTAKVLPVSPGHHAVKLKNPHCKEKTLDVVVKKGEVFWLRPRLQCSKKSRSKTRNKGRNRSRGKP